MSVAKALDNIYAWLSTALVAIASGVPAGSVRMPYLSSDDPELAANGPQPCLSGTMRVSGLIHSSRDAAMLPIVA